MFGPNTTLNVTTDINYSHRDIKFKRMFKDLQAQFKSNFALNNYDILFIPGSGSFAMELLLLNFNGKINIEEPSNGKFTERWKNLNTVINKKPRDTFEVTLGCQFETSISRFNDDIACDPNTIVDAVCSFPYYRIPNKSVAFVTVTNKMLGSFPGLAIICIRKDCWKLFSFPFGCFSTLDLRLYKEYAAKGMTPTTAPTHIFQHLHKIMKNGFSIPDLTQRVDFVCKLLSCANFVTVGEKIAPALTIPKMTIPRKDLVNKYQLYGSESSDMNYHIFTYSEDPAEYLKLVYDFGGFNREGSVL